MTVVSRVMTAIIAMAIAAVGPAYAAKILAVFPHHGYSHHVVYLPLLRELANRGHDVTAIANYPSAHPNITDLSLDGFIPLYNNKQNLSAFAGRIDGMGDVRSSVFAMRMFYERSQMNEAMFALDAVKRLLSDHGSPTKRYDLIVTEHFNNELFLAFVSKFGVPFVLASSCGLLPWSVNAMGQPYSLAISPLTLGGQRPAADNLYGRAMKTVAHVVQLLGFTVFCRAKDERFIRNNLTMDVSLDRLILNASLMLVNTHFTMYGARPVVPAVVEIGGIHVETAKPLPADIQKYIDEAEHGVIYFCMGSLLRGETFPAEKRQMFINVFEKIPQRILWKWEGELPGKPSNVLTRKWMPQRDILAHPNVKLFISHGGLLGTTEAVYEGVPILSMPIFGDQMTNVRAVVDKGAAEMMVYGDLNEDEIFKKITSMLSNPTYKQKAKDLSEAFRDRPMSPLDTAVYWTEYVIRHKGAPHLRSAAVGMPWYQYYLIDVLLVIFLSIAVIFVVLYYLIFKVLLRMLTNQKLKEKQN